LQLSSSEGAFASGRRPLDCIAPEIGPRLPLRRFRASLQGSNLLRTMSWLSGKTTRLPGRPPVLPPNTPKWSGSTPRRSSSSRPPPPPLGRHARHRPAPEGIADRRRPLRVQIGAAVAHASPAASGRRQRPR
jgi:hypothetical protein